MYYNLLAREEQSNTGETMTNTSATPALTSMLNAALDYADHTSAATIVGILGKEEGLDIVADRLNTEFPSLAKELPESPPLGLVIATLRVLGIKLVAVPAS